MTTDQPQPSAVSSTGDATARPVVVGVDGSAGSEAALAWAAAEAQAHDRPLTVVHAADPVAFYGYPVPPAAAVREAGEVGEHLLDNAVKHLFGEARPAGVTRVLREGNPARVLVEVAQDASLLVVGAQGHGHFLLGSVSDRCVHHASCPVVVIH